MSALKHLKVAPKEAHTATVIILHGLGDSGHGWLPVAKALWSSFPNVKWILPHAPTIPITVNGGMSMPGWFDIYSFVKDPDPLRWNEDEPGLFRSVASIDALVQAEIDAGIPEDRIVLTGFSQGGAVATLAALSGKRQYAGVAALSTWVPLTKKADELFKNEKAKDIPVFWGHGIEDPLIVYDFGKRSVEFLKSRGFPAVPAGQAFARPGVRFESYEDMGHSTCPREIEDYRAWLAGVLNK